MAYLENIKHPDDIKTLSQEGLEVLAEEIRETIIQVTSQNGGHIGPNLGVVELTLALHRVFSTPQDSFTFDVSHQGYVHKLLTGRCGEGFQKLRKTGGVSGFLSRSESEHDCFGAGHAGTALSAAVGMATARDLLNSEDHVVAVLGDAAFTCGITMEALNNITSSTKRLIIVLNDNEWSISKNVGALAHYLNELITTPTYNRLHNDLESFLKRVPGGESIIRFGSKAKKEAKDFLVPSSLFEKYGIRYIGPIDGHDIGLLTQYLEFCKHSPEPIILHTLTKKGKGYEVAIKNPEKFHGTGPFDRETGESAPKKPGTPPNYQDVFGKAMVRFAKEDEKIVGITAAMPAGTSLKMLQQECPEQFFDIGIAEEHGVIFAAGMATKGFKPVCGIYSTFLQRAFDCIMHDVCLQDLDVTFCMDRAGLSPNDGPTHHGLFDIAYLRCIPRTVVMQPKDEDELVDMIRTAIDYKGPSFVRYPRGAAVGVTIKDTPKTLPIGKAEVLRPGKDIILWALGPMVQDALGLAQIIAEEYGLSVGVVNARFAKPLDIDLLQEHAQKASLIVTLEDHVRSGGFGSAVLEALQELKLNTPVELIGWPDKFVSHGSSIADLRQANDLSPEAMQAQIMQRFEALSPLNSPTAETAFTPSS